MLLKKLSFVMIVPEGTSDQSLRASTDGTGPYTLAGRRADEIRLRRNDRYWGPAPAVREAVFRLYLDTEVTLRGLVRGEYAIALCNSRKVDSGPGLRERHEIVHSSAPQRGLGMFNYEGYSSAELDRAIESSAGTESVDERGAMLREIMAATAHDLVLLPLYNDQDLYAIDRERGLCGARTA